MAMNSYVNENLFKEFTKVEFFDSLSYEEIEWILMRGEMSIVAQGDHLIEENSDGRDFYILLDGEMLISQEKCGKKEVVLTLYAGSIIGEIGALLHLKRTASVEAKTECVVLRYTDALFRETEKLKPTLANTLYRNVISILIHRYAITKKDE